jgi:hypothetical protein
MPSGLAGKLSTRQARASSSDLPKSVQVIALSGHGAGCPRQRSLLEDRGDRRAPQLGWGNERTTELVVAGNRGRGGVFARGGTPMDHREAGAPVRIDMACPLWRVGVR